VKEEVLDAAHAAIAILAATPEVDPKEIVVVGHSLGGYLAPRIAADDGRVAGLVILAGNTRPIQDLVLDQFRYLGAPSAAIDNALRFKATVESPLLTADGLLPSLAGGVTGAYFLDLRGYRPELVAARLARPMLIVRGERDYQVAQADFDGWKAAVCDQPLVECKQYPGLNHLFVAGAGRSTPAEYGQPGHVDKVVVDDIDFWLRALPRKLATQPPEGGKSTR
jgi:uncharacterized protein